MPAQRFHTKEIGEHIQSFLDAEFKIGGPQDLGIKKTHFGGAEFLPTPQGLADIIPIIFVKPAPSATIIRGPALDKIRVTDLFRIIYMRKFETVEELEKIKVTDAVKIADKLMKEFLLPTLALSDEFFVIDSLVTDIEWEIPEDDAPNAAGQDLHGVAIVFEITTQGPIKKGL